MIRASAPSYDRFKSIITAILVIILILMLLRGCATNSAAPPIPNATELTIPSSTPPAGETTVALTPTEPSAPTDTPTVAPASPTSTIVAPTLTPTTVIAETPTTIPETATPGQVQSTSCNTSVPSRLSVGHTARVLTRLNMRSDASIGASLIQTNPANTQVEIIGGPVCESVGDRAYQWWQIRLPDGSEGWSAETQLNTPSYFLEPLP